MERTFFITGTDTGVGKTIVTAALAASFRQKEIPIGVMKPLESGCETRQLEGKAALIPADTLFLKEISGCDDLLDTLNPYRFSEALAPAVAAKLAGIPIDPKKILNCANTLQKKYGTLLIEGAGGLMVPQTPHMTTLDLIQFLNVPVLLVAKNALGTINHTLLSLEALEARKIRVIGIIFNRVFQEEDPSQKYNIATLKEWTSTPVLGELAYLNSLSGAEQLSIAVKEIFKNFIQFL